MYEYIGAETVTKVEGGGVMSSLELSLVRSEANWEGRRLGSCINFQKWYYKKVGYSLCNPKMFFFLEINYL